MDIREQYQRPQVGQVVRLDNGQTAAVVTVMQANAVLKMMTEAQAIALATRARARFGHRWREIYYHADVMYPSGQMDTVDPSKVKEVLDPP